MTDIDIPSLIERIKAGETMQIGSTLREAAAEALSLTVSPLPPEEIAGLIEKLRDYHGRTGAYAPSATCSHGVHPYDCQEGCAPVPFKAAAALERMAREIAEMRAWRHAYGELVKQLEADRDAIRAKTIEDCAHIADKYATEATNAAFSTRAQLAEIIRDEIRALNQQKPETE